MDESTRSFVNAVRENDIEEVERLIESGVDVNAKDEHSNTALLSASWRGYTEIVKLLLEHKDIDVNAKHFLDSTALQVASLNGNTEIVKMFLEQKDIDIDARDKKGHSAWFYAWFYAVYGGGRGNREIVELIEEARNNKGEAK